LNAKKDIIDNSSIEKENDVNSNLTSYKEGDYVLRARPGKVSEKDWLVNIVLGGKDHF